MQSTCCSLSLRESPRTKGGKHLSSSTHTPFPTLAPNKGRDTPRVEPGAREGLSHSTVMQVVSCMLSGRGLLTIQPPFLKIVYLLQGYIAVYPNHAMWLCPLFTFCTWRQTYCSWHKGIQLDWIKRWDEHHYQPHDICIVGCKSFLSPER